MPRGMGAGFAQVSVDDFESVKYVVLVRMFGTDDPQFEEVLVESIEEGRRMTIEKIQEYVRKHLKNKK